MLVQPTLEQLYAMRLNGMAEAFRRQLEDAGASELSFEERFALLVESQWTWKQSRALTRRQALAKLKQPACVEDIDFRHPRGLERARWMSLAQRVGVGAAQTERGADWADGSRQKLSGVRLGTAGLPGRFQCTVHAGPATVPARELPHHLLAASGVQPRPLRGLLAASSCGCARPCLAENGTGRPVRRPCP